MTLNNQVKTLPMPTVDGREITRDAFLDQFFNRRAPVLLKGGCADWALMEKWSVDYLKAAMGDFQCTIARDSRPSYAKEKCSLKEFFNASPRLNTISIEQFEPTSDLAFLNDILLPNKFFSMAEITAYVYFNCAKDSGSLPHCHMDAFNVLQSGIKHWVMYEAHPDISPIGSQALRECHEQYPEGSHSRDWFLEGGGSAAMDRGIDVYEFVQEAGDIVYIPDHYAHAILNLGDTQGVAVFVERQGVTYQTFNGHYSPK